MKTTIQVVAKRDRHVFEVLPRRWVVERTSAWIRKHRRTVRDYEKLPASHEAMITWAMIALMTRLAYPAGPIIRRSLTADTRADTIFASFSGRGGFPPGRCSGACCSVSSLISCPRAVSGLTR
jgi:hypothetical protein